MPRRSAISGGALDTTLRGGTAKDARNGIGRADAWGGLRSALDFAPN
jgi:hypothetical protein